MAGQRATLAVAWPDGELHASTEARQGWFMRAVGVIVAILSFGGMAASHSHGETLDTIPWPIVRSGATGDNVRLLQQLLAVRGIHTPVTGAFDDGTDAAVREFQASVGLTVDGIVGRDTWRALLGRDTVLRNPTRGSAAVRALQAHITAIGVAAIAADGDFGPATEAAVRAFQRERGLTESGEVGINDWHALIVAASPSARDHLTHRQAMDRLLGTGVRISSSGACHDRYRTNCTSLEQIRAEQVQGVIDLQNRLPGSCRVTVTGGTEIGHSRRGSETHFLGFKIDIRSTGDGQCVTDFIRTNYTRIGERGGDGALLYEDQREGVSASERDRGLYALEDAPPHWDITYR